VQYRIHAGESFGMPDSPRDSTSAPDLGQKSGVKMSILIVSFYPCTIIDFRKSLNVYHTTE